MANPYKEAEKNKKKPPARSQEAQDAQKEEAAVVTPGEPEAQQEAKEAPVSEPVPEQAAEVAEEKPVEEKTAEPDPAPVRLILEDLFTEEKNPGSATYGFYLDNDVHAELIRLAKKSKMNKSRFLNKLLRRVLFNE